MSLLTDLLTRGGRRTHAAVTLMACSCLCLSLLILSLAAYLGRQVQVEIAAVVSALSGLVGWVYKVGKHAGASVPTAPGEVVPASVPDGGKP